MGLFLKFFVPVIVRDVVEGNGIIKLHAVFRPVEESVLELLRRRIVDLWRRRGRPRRPKTAAWVMGVVTLISVSLLPVRPVVGSLFER